MASRRTDVRRAHTPACCETLESRRVLASTEVAAVGLSFHQAEIARNRLGPPVYATYALHGHVTDTDTLRYRLRRDGANGPAAPTALREAALRRHDDGTFDYENNRWRGTGLEFGSWFLPRDGFTMGWWRARKDEWIAGRDSMHVEHSEQQLIVPLATASTPLRKVQGSWRFSMVERDIEGRVMNVYTGTLDITIADRRVQIIDEASGNTIADTIINSGTGGSRFTTSAGQQFYLSEDGSTLVFVDLANADGAIHIGSAVREATEVTEREVAGTYRVIGIGPSYSGVRPADLLLTLNPDGTYDAGGQWLIIPTGLMGTWLVDDNGEIVVRPRAGGSEVRFVLVESRAALLLASTSIPGDTFAIGHREVVAPTPGDPALGYASVGDAGEGLVFVDRAHSPWMVADVAAESGGPSATGKLVTWFDPDTGLARGAAATDRGLAIYSELANGAWTYEVLAESLGTGTMVRPEIATTRGPRGLINIFGLSPEGDLIRYVQSRGSEGEWHEWNFTENQLEARGLATPSFIGPIVAARTLWGGLNIAGIDANGDLVTVWTTPSAGRWFVSNLSEYTGIDPLWSGLDMVAAGRHGIHFSAIDTSGQLTVISWQRSMARWTASTFTTSPPMQRGEVATAFDGARRALLVTSIRSDTGALMVHLVPLSFSAPEPFKATISGAGAPPERRVRRGIDIQVGWDYRINAFGMNFDDETVLFTSFDPINGAWPFENLTEIAV